MAGWFGAVGPVGGALPIDLTPQTADTALVGAATLVITTTADLTTAVTLIGAGTLTITVSSDLTTAIRFTGTANLVITTSSALTTSIALTASATLVITTSSALTTSITLVGAATLVITTAAVLTSPGAALAGAATLVITTASALTTAIPLIGNATLVITTTSALTTAIRPTGAATLVITTASSLTTAITLVGAGTLVITTQATLAATGAPLTGTATLAITTAASLTTAITATGAATLAITTASALTTSIRFTGAASLTINASGALTSGAAALQGAATLALTTASSLTTAIRFTSTATLAVTATGSLTTGITLTGEGAGAVLIRITTAATLAPAILPTPDYVIRVRADDVVFRVRADDVVLLVPADDLLVRVRIEDTAVPGDSYALAVVAESPEGYWRLGELSGLVAVDSSGHGRDGAYVGGVVLGQPGVLSDGNPAARFDGLDDKVTVASTAFNFTGNALSIEAWINQTGSTSDQGIVGTSLPTYTSGYALTLHDDGFVYFYIGSGGNNAGFTAGGAGWHHVVGTWNGTTGANGMKLYIDGVLRAQHTSNTAVLTGTALRMGQGNTFFNGLIDEVAVYPYVMGPQQIARHYDLKMPPSAVSVRVRADDVVVLV